MEHAYERMDESSRALAALARENLLETPLLKASVGMLIRQSTESRHYHSCAQYRSAEAASIIRREQPRTSGAYHLFCRKNFRHEHMVPVGVLRRMILLQKLKTAEEISKLLTKYAIRATVTIAEDELLNGAGLKLKMPPGFDLRNPSDPLGRYLAVNLADTLEARPVGKLWHEVP